MTLSGPDLRGRIAPQHPGAAGRQKCYRGAVSTIEVSRHGHCRGGTMLGGPNDSSRRVD